MGTFTAFKTAGDELPSSTLQALISELRPIVGRCSSTLTKNADVTLANITGAAVAVAANTTYYMWAGVQVNGNATADFKVGFTFPTGLTMRYKTHGFNTGGAYVSINCIQTDVFGWGAGGVAAGGDDVILMEGWVFNGSTAGTLQMQGAQQVSNVSNTVFQTTGCYIMLLQSE